MCIRDRFCTSVYLHDNLYVEGNVTLQYAPTTNEVIFIVNQGCDKCDIVICARDARLLRIAETDWVYDGL